MEKRSASIITPEMEKQLWSPGILGLSSPRSLLNAVFFYNGKSFALRRVKEQTDLRFDQLKRKFNPDGYTYIEHGSKNHSGAVDDQSNGKVISIVDTSNSKISHVKILDLYISTPPLPVLSQAIISTCSHCLSLLQVTGHGFGKLLWAKTSCRI